MRLYPLLFSGVSPEAQGVLLGPEIYAMIILSFGFEKQNGGHFDVFCHTHGGRGQEAESVLRKTRHRKADRERGKTAQWKILKIRMKMRRKR